jgi:hypothetical protein
MFTGALAAMGILFAWISSWDSDEYAVYRVTADQLHGSDGVRDYVISNKTYPCNIRGISRFHAKKLNLPLSVTLNYWIKNTLCRELQNNLPLSHPVVLLPEADVKGIYDPSALENAKTKEIRLLLGRSYGAITFSRVGFNLAHTRAAIYLELIDCGLCGGGNYYSLEKQNGIWRVTGIAGTWIS